MNEGNSSGNRQYQIRFIYFQKEFALRFSFVSLLVSVLSENKKSLNKLTMVTILSTIEIQLYYNRLEINKYSCWRYYIIFETINFINILCNKLNVKPHYFY